jgi:autoinducer 2-degrading protein
MDGVSYTAIEEDIAAWLLCLSKRAKEGFMYVLMVNVHVKPEHRDAFIESITTNAVGTSTQEQGCLRFDIVQNNDDPNRFFFYEVYRSEADLEAHRASPHFQQYAKLSPEFLAEPPARVGGSNVYPADDAWR